MDDEKFFVNFVFVVIAGFFIRVLSWVLNLKIRDPAEMLGTALILTIRECLILIGVVIVAPFLIYLLGGLILKFLKTMYVNWQKTKEWVEEIDTQIKKMKQSISIKSDKLHSLEYDNETLRETVLELKRELEEMKSFTGIKEKEAVDQAAADFIGE